ncbi:MAG: DUF11 domain-containing protein [Dehalococcoidia bacterium]
MGPVFGTAARLHCSVSRFRTISPAPSRRRPAAVLYNAPGVATLTKVMMAKNQSEAHGGGIFNALGATLTVASSTLSGNIADVDDVGIPGNGGGIYNAGVAGRHIHRDREQPVEQRRWRRVCHRCERAHDQELQHERQHRARRRLRRRIVQRSCRRGPHRLINVTLSGKNAVAGGGITKRSAGTLDLINVTIVDNSATTGPNINNVEGTVRFFNTVVTNGAGAATVAPAPARSPPWAVTWRRVRPGRLTHVASTHGTDQQGVNPQPGRWRTTAVRRRRTGRCWAARPSTPAWRPAWSMPRVVCPGQDQRGIARPQDGVAGPPVVCDKGAVEVAALALARRPPAPTCPVTKVDVTDPFVAGSGDLVYIITVTNLGPATATGVAVRDTLPAGWTFVRGQFLTGAGALGACSQ